MSWLSNRSLRPALSATGSSLLLLTTLTGSLDEARAEAAGESAKTEAAVVNATKVLALPYQSIFRTVPQEKLDKATELLRKELGAPANIEVIQGAVATEAAQGPSLAEAEKLAKAADEAEKDKDIEKAIDLWTKALAAFESNAAALEDSDPYLRARHRYARALKLAGRDKEAKQAIDAAARMNPAFELTRTEYDRLYRLWFRQAGETVVREKRGKLLVKSVLPGATVTLDGREMDVAPVLLEQVVPGRHMVSASIEGVPPFAAMIDVRAGQQAELTASFSGTSGGNEVGKVAEAVARNEIPKDAVASAAKAGKQAGASFVVLGAMVKNKNDDKYRVHTYVVPVDKPALIALAQINFDLDFLTAESDVLRIARSAQTAIEKPSAGTGALAKIDDKVRGSSTVNRVNASPEVASRRTRTTRTKDSKRPVFRPLRGGSIVIKDEEE